MQDQIDLLFMENNLLKERFREKDKHLSHPEDSIKDTQFRATEAMKQG